MKYIFAVLTFFAGCGGSNDFECELGNLRGTWQAVYNEVEGNCGYISPEIAEFKPGPLPYGCIGKTVVSPDACTMIIDITCPTDNGRGMLRQTWDIEQTTTISIEGTLRLYLKYPGFSCLSTYRVDIRKL